MPVPPCGATTKQGGTPCKKTAGWGTKHPGFGRCKLHGGATQNHLVSAQREQAEQAVVTYGLAREVDPHQALLEELHRTAGHVAWLAIEVAALEQDNLTHLIVARDAEDSESSRTEVIDERPNVYLDLYHRERKHYIAIAKTCVDVGIEERRVRVAEQQGALLAQVIRGVLEDLGVADRPEVPDVVRRRLTLVAG